MKIILTLSLFCASLSLGVNFASAATFNDVDNGDWNIGTTWGGACASSCVSGVDYPGSNDTAIIDSNSISLTTNQTVGDITISGGSFNTAGFNFSVVNDFIQTAGNVTSSPSGTFSVGGSFSIPGPGVAGTFSRFTGSGTLGDPYLISDVYGLQAMNGFLSSNFKLNNNIDAIVTHSWNYSSPPSTFTGFFFEGFLPVGNENNPFIGTFDGDSNVVSGLYMDYQSADRGGLLAGGVGLFGDISESASIANIGMEDTSIYSWGVGGGLVGKNFGTISKSYIHNILMSAFDWGGGLVGYNFGTINDSYTAEVYNPYIGGDSLGSLVGINIGTITNSFGYGDVMGGHTCLGGLVGCNSNNAGQGGTIENSYTTANVTSSSLSDSDFNTGGLIGQYIGHSSTGSIINSYFTDSVHDNGLGTLETNSPSTFFGSSHSYAVYTGWDFNTVWDAFDTDYPHLQWENYIPLPPKYITAFNFDGLTPAVTGIVTSDHTISIAVPPDTDVTNLVPTITIVGSSISPASGVAQDFTNPVIYTVTASDSTTQQYTVRILNSNATISSGTLAAQSLTGDFAGGADIVNSSSLAVTIVNTSRIDASLLLNKGYFASTINYVVGTQPNDDTEYVDPYAKYDTYITVLDGDVIWLLVTAEDGITKLYYKIIVTVTINSDATISSGTLAAQSLTGDFTGGIDTANSSALTVTILDISQTNAILSLTKSYSASIIKYVINGPPTQDSDYINTYVGNTSIPVVNDGDIIWLLVTAEDGTTKLYYKITVTVTYTGIAVALTYTNNPTGTGTQTITATYSEAVTSAPNISIDQPGTTDITNIAMNGSGTVYTYAYTVNQANGSTYLDGTATVSLSTVTNGLGYPSSSPTNNTFTIDTTGPTVALTYTNNPTGTGTQTITATYSEAVISAPNISIDQPGTTDITNASMVAPASVWTPQTASQANSWNSITYGNGLFVAVSSDGAVMTSPDGITWTAQSAMEANGWTFVTYGNGLFVAVAEGGTNQVMTSPDGITWTPQTAAEANTWMSVTYGNGLFVAVSGEGNVMTSPDGITWTARTAAEANVWISVTYGNGLFVAVSQTGTKRVMTSPDGITWTPQTAVTAAWRSVTYGNGLFVAVASSFINRVMTSPNGITWTPQTAAQANQWYSVTYGNGLFVAVSSDGIIDSVMTSPGNFYTYSYTVNQANGSTYIDGTATVSLSSVTDLLGHTSSAPTNNTFTIDTTAPSTPVASSISGTYYNDTYITLTAEGSDFIRYSTTETPTDCSSGTLYSNPISVSLSQTIYVRACDFAENDSSTTSFDYVIKVIKPVTYGSTLASRTNFLAEQQALTLPPPITSPVNTPTLTRNLKLITNRMMRGNDISELQIYLNTQGYNSGIADGIFGPKTKAAVILFQKANGLTPDGIVGPKTIEMIK